VFGLWLYPKFKNVPQPVARPQGHGEDLKVNRWEFPVDECYGIVVSHCCEFNEAKRARFLVARISDFPTRITDAQREKIEASNDAVKEGAEEERYEYLETFVLEPIPGCFDEKMVVDFTTIMPFPKSEQDRVGALKQAELDQEHRIKLRKKLALFFGRDAPDVADDKKRDPPPRPGRE